MNSQDFSYARRGRWEKASREGVSSGSSAAASSSSEVEEAAATPLGLMTSNSVVFFVSLEDVDELEGMAFLRGAGSGLGGMY